MKIAIACDFKKGKFLAYCDGIEVDSLEQQGLNFADTLCSISSTQPNLKSFTLTKWNGKVSEKSESIGIDNTTTDLFYFTNGDITSGALDSLDQGIYSFDSPVGKFRCEVRDVSKICLAEKEVHTRRLNKDDIRLTLNNGCVITALLKSLNNSRIRISNEIFGDISFSVDSISLIESNLYK